MIQEGRHPSPPPAKAGERLRGVLGTWSLLRGRRAAPQQPAAPQPPPPVKRSSLESDGPAKAHLAPVLMGPSVNTPGASPGSVDFSKRASELAAVLDKLSPGDKSSEIVTSGSEKDCCSATKQTSHFCLEKCLDEIEVSAAAKRKAAASLSDEFMGEAEEDSDSDGVDDAGDEDDFNEEEPGNESSSRTAQRRQAKRRRLDPGLMLERPPGTPAVQSASEEVSAAVAAVEKRHNTQTGGAVASKPGGSSYGPRFQGLSAQDLIKTRSKWQLHSLSDVKQMSSEENRRAAQQLFEQLRKKREADQIQDEPANEMVTASKPVFRRPTPRESGASAGKPLPSADLVSQPGMRILEACVAGSSRPRKVEQNDKATTAVVPNSKKRASICSLSMEDVE